MKIWKVDVFNRDGNSIRGYPRIYLCPQGPSGVKGYWLNRGNLDQWRAINAPYTVDVKTLEVSDDDWR